MSYLAYATWCKSLGITPASEERWNKLRDRNPYPSDRSSDRHKYRKDRQGTEIFETPLGTVRLRVGSNGLYEEIDENGRPVNR